ncbi:MAG: DUF4893 domain-containing protein [Alphaproteobacteria bacterium]|nr:DUF4893 domain-containing protein [Alphaproteobacteria bacterium]
MLRLIFCAIAIVLLSQGALADGILERTLSAADRNRLSRFDATLAEALTEAGAGAADDLALVQDVLRGKALPMAGSFNPVGPWRCRVIKLGGLLPLTVYPWFKCAIAEDGAGWTLEKLTGSQRTRGRFYTASDTRLIYVGAGHVTGESPRNYGDDPKQDQVAVVERRTDRRILLLFPAPYFESKLDILVLER